MKSRFESPQNKAEEIQKEPIQDSEIKKNSIWRKIRNLIVAGSTLAMATHADAQKADNSRINPLIVTNKNDARLKAYKDSLEAYQYGVDDYNNSIYKDYQDALKKDSRAKIVNKPPYTDKETWGSISPKVHGLKPIELHRAELQYNGDASVTQSRDYAVWKKPKQEVIYIQKEKEEKTKPPIYVPDKDDPRIKKYQDSLSSYKWTQKMLKHINETQTSPQGKPLRDLEYEIISNEDLIKQYGPKEFHRMAGVVIPKNNFRYTLMTGGPSDLFNYKKPIQPYIYRPEVKKDTVIIKQKPPEQRALEKKNESSLPEIEKTKYQPEQERTNWFFIYPDEKGNMQHIYFKNKSEYDVALKKVLGSKPKIGPFYLGSKEENGVSSALFAAKPEN